MEPYICIRYICTWICVSMGNLKWIYKSTQLSYKNHIFYHRYNNHWYCDHAKRQQYIYSIDFLDDCTLVESEVKIWVKIFSIDLLCELLLDVIPGLSKMLKLSQMLQSMELV